MLTDTQWERLEPLIEACRPKGKTPPQDLRRTLSAILWRHENGAKWGSRHRTGSWPLLVIMRRVGTGARSGPGRRGRTSAA